ncbi:MAG: hypothetical protein M1832_004961 [Thelocarpon impressellum]|nr:MAG: hypothetical protein M1832_004961 [Thelocarpon impressellum]
MPAISADDPLWAVCHVRPLPEDNPLLRQARDLINGDPCAVLSPEQQAKAREQLHELLRMSRDQAAAAQYVVQGIEEGGVAQLHNKLRQASGASDASDAQCSASPRRVAQLVTESCPPKPEPAKSSSSRSSTFSKWVTANQFCRVTGRPGGPDGGVLEAAHILPRMHGQQRNSKSANLMNLLGALFGVEAVEALIQNVLNAGENLGRGIDRHDNGIALQPTVHREWDRTLFSLEVDWNTLDRNTGEFTCRFRQHGTVSFRNYWIPSTTSSAGRSTFAELEDGDEIPIRRATHVSGRELLLPSPFLLHVRDVIGRIAHMMGAAGWDDLDDSESDGWEEPMAAAPAQPLLPSSEPAKDHGVSDWLKSVDPEDDDEVSGAAAWSGCVRDGHAAWPR